MTAAPQTAAEPLAPNLQMVGDFLRRRGFPAQIVTIDPDLPSCDPGKMAARIFQAAEPTQKWIAEQNSQRRNIYFTVNLLRPSAVFNKKPSKADIEALKWLHVDLDPADGETPRQAKERAFAALKKFNPGPSVVINSGGGVQAFWVLREPVAVNDGNLAELELVNKSLEIALGGDHCHNLDRIMRMPGTVNWPDQKKRARGRVPTLAKLAYFGPETYELSQFPIVEEARGKTNGDKPHVDLGDDVPLVDDLAAFPGLGAKGWLRLLIERGNSDLKPYPSRSEALCAVVHGLIDCDLTDAEIAGIVLNPNFGISESVLERKGGAVKCAAAEIARARSKHEAPQPQSAAAEPAWPILNPAARHGFIGRLLEVIEPHTEADTAALIGQFLAAFGIAVGRGPHAMVEATRHGTNLDVAIVGDSSKARKGTAWDQVERLVRQADSTWPERMSSGLSTGEGLIHVVRDLIMKQQPIKAQGKVTGYETVIEDPGVEDKRILVIESELASVLKVATREGNTISPLLRAAWDGKTLRTMTRNSPLKATDPHVGVIGHITRLELQRLLTETEAGNGLGSRILWLCTRRSKVLPDGGYVDPIAISDLTAQLAGIIQTAKDTGRLRRNAEATTAWRAVYPALSEGKLGLLGALTNRGEAQVLRLSMLYALLDQAPEIRLEHLRAALAVWEYAERSAAFIFGDSLGDPVADMIWSALKAAPDGLTRTEISGLLSRNRGAEQIDRALRSLSSLGLARQHLDRSTGGRPLERWSRC